MTTHSCTRWSALLLLSCVTLSSVTLTGCSKKSSDSAAGGNGSKEGGSNAKDAQSAGGGESKGGEAGGGSKAQSGSGGDQTSETAIIPPDQQRRVGIVIGPVQTRSEPRMLIVAGQVQTDEQHTSHLGAIADGRITEVDAVVGAHVERGAVLGMLHSHMVHETVGALMQAFGAVDRAKAALAFAQQEQARYAHLYSIQAASLEESQRSQQDLVQAQTQLADAEAGVKMEREHLSELLQVEPESLTPSNLYDKELVPIRAAISGTVLMRNVSVGQVVATGDETFVVSNLSTVWVTAAVNEQDLPLMHAGAGADITTQGYPDQLFHGRVVLVGDTLDPTTRTVPVRIAVPNPGTRLRPGMFATAHVAEPQTTRSVFVPESALQDINGMQVVFVTADGTHFRAQTVKLGLRTAGSAQVIDGLRPGDHIAIGGAFMVKSELLKGTMGEG